jgi:hypothetical protein
MPSLTNADTAHAALTMMVFGALFAKPLDF